MSFFDFALRAVLGLTCLSMAGSLWANEPERPNVVLVLVDDLGWTDFACYGSDFYETPNIDQLARDGMRFTQSYSACTVCSPTRASLLTGKYPARLHITDWIPGQMPQNPRSLVPDWTKFLPLHETTIADIFKSSDYSTASIGKWHLGGPDTYPEKHGFDLNIAGTHLPQPPKGYFAPWEIHTLSEGKPGEHLTPRLGAEVDAYLRRNGEKPFFLYFPHYGVHTPIQGRADLVKKYEAKLRPGLNHTNAQYGALLEDVDTTIGQIRRTLDELKLSDRTIIIVTSDNGGRIPTTSNRPLRAGKGSCYEGGVRVPLIVYWPGITRSGSTCSVPTITADLYPTVLEMAHLKDKPGHHLDGLSLVPLLKGSGSLPTRDLFWHYPHHQHYQKEGAMPYSAILSGEDRLIEFLDDNHVELYNLANDPGEAHDLAASQPERAKALRAKLDAWRKAVGAQMPTSNPNYDPSRPQHPPRAPKPQG